MCLLIVDIDFGFIMHLFLVGLRVFFVGMMSEAVEHFKRKVAGLKKESEELERFKRDIDWLKTLQKKLVRDGFD